jgi:predicted phosphoribosyltransferase
MDTGMILTDRRQAGKRLAEALEGFAGRDDVIVLGLPRGGVVVAFEVARVLGAPLDVYLVRKLGVPGHEELALGAIASGGVTILNQDVVQAMQVTQAELETISRREQTVLERRERLYRGHSEPLDLAGKTVIVVDDGLATGATMRTAVRSIRDHGPARVVVAVPVAPPDTCLRLRDEADEAVCLMTPEPFHAIGSWYLDFSQTTDEEVVDLLEKAGPSGTRSAAVATGEEFH